MLVPSTWYADSRDYHTCVRPALDDKVPVDGNGNPLDVNGKVLHYRCHHVAGDATHATMFEPVDADGTRLVIRQDNAQPRPSQGETISVSVDPGSIHVFSASDGTRRDIPG